MVLRFLVRIRTVSLVHLIAQAGIIEPRLIEKSTNEFRQFLPLRGLMFGTVIAAASLLPDNSSRGQGSSILELVKLQYKGRDGELSVGRGAATTLRGKRQPFTLVLSACSYPYLLAYRKYML